MTTLSPNKFNNKKLMNTLKKDDKVFNRIVNKNYIPKMEEISSKYIFNKLVEHYNLKQHIAEGFEYFDERPDLQHYRQDKMINYLKYHFVTKFIPIQNKSMRDNQNPITNGKIITHGYLRLNRNKIRIPSKKHKNRYKNFSKMFCE